MNVLWRQERGAGVGVERGMQRSAWEKGRVPQITASEKASDSLSAPLPHSLMQTPTSRGGW